MSEPFPTEDLKNLDPVHEIDGEPGVGAWTRRLVLFLRVMAGVSMIKGLYHWSRVCGIGVGSNELYEVHSVAWQAATVFFAVIDLVAAVGLWLAAAWGGVVWLTAAISMTAIELMFPQVYGGRLWVAGVEIAMIVIYSVLTWKAGSERPE